MKTLLILGSRNPEGQTARAANALLSGMTDKRGMEEKVFLPSKKVERCRQCNLDGWGTCKTEGTCVIKDDFATLVDKIRGADAVIFATPVYFSDLSESMRAFLDRLRRTARHEAGKKGITDKPAVGICVAGGGGGGAPACSMSLEKILNTCSLNVVDMIPIRRQNLDAKLHTLKTTGRSLATSESE